MSTHRYGRGKFQAHENYVEYMRKIVTHPNFKDMPNAVSADGRINWQVSSGKTTSFYQDYLARKAWWEKKVTDLGLAVNNSETGLFTIAARLLNPSGYRPCRLCGKEMNVGYFYINKNFTRRLEKDFSELSFHLTAPISEVISSISNSKHSDRLIGMFENYFPERTSIFKAHGVTTVAFEKSNHIGTTKLSPGFMGNPPDRLDGFHDYCVACRKNNDPGRSDENMRTYNRDRRTFEWWAEGNWALADALYNSAGPGKCCFEGCTEMLEKVSPDHVGPLACGFKQLPLFVPSCPKHNSAKNRRFSYSDVQKLIGYEQTTGASVASWQVRSHWDFYKSKITSDGDAKALSNSMRSLQDMYFRVLRSLLDLGKERFLATLLHPEFAVLDFQLNDLNRSALTFSSYDALPNISDLRLLQRTRVLRVAFEALNDYTSKGAENRKMVRSDFLVNKNDIESAISKISMFSDNSDRAWLGVFNPKKIEEHEISKLLLNHRAPTAAWDCEAKKILAELFDKIGLNAEVDFSRYSSDEFLPSIT